MRYAICLLGLLAAAQAALAQAPAVRQDHPRLFIADVAAHAAATATAAPAEFDVAFGNCCQASDAADIRISGCPPYPFALGEALRKQ